LRISLKWVHAITFGEGPPRAKLSKLADSKPMPSLVNVPLPNSSIRHRDLQNPGPIQKERDDPVEA
jgi:hypothetical protein